VILEGKDLVVHYGNIQALHGVSFAVQEGEIVTLIGANGAGKSTILKTVSGLVRAKSGEVRFRGQDISRVPAHEIVKRGMSHVPEGRGIIEALTVWENLLLGAYTRQDKGEIEESVERAFASFPRLKERRTQLAGTLSGGEQQMLAIARGLMSRPSVLLLDEPSMGLAPILVDEIFDIVKRINEEGTTILLVEQNAFMALQIAHRAYCLETGRVVLEGSAEELRTHPRVRSAYLGEI
jgi:branched-chain amino acid transport system ATP-binding protein